MLGWFQALMPKEDKFFDLFARHADTLVAGSSALRELLEGGPSVPACSARIATLESEADAITREVMIAVRRTFITPFDRGDIQQLITSMDDAIDQMHQTSKAINLFEVIEFDPRMKAIGDLSIQAARLTVEAVAALRNMRQEAGRLTMIADKVAKLEETSDQLHDQGIKELFSAHRQTDVMAFIIGSEIYADLEKVLDRFEDVANCINGIVIEHL
jgi:predicted phosphate transport protein (TIGR00153 family)